MSRLFTILRWTIAVVFALTVYSASAQPKPAPAALVFAAGCFEGVMDHLQFHYDRPNQFWNPDISWRNKYRNGDPANGMTFRGKYLVFTTDGWHLMKFGRNATIMTSLVLNIGEKPKRWWVYIVDAASYWAINRIGFNLTYKWIRL